MKAPLSKDEQLFNELAAPRDAGFTAAQIEEGSIAPEKLDQLRKERAAKAKGIPEAHALSPSQEMAANIRDFTKNPVARGAVAGFSELGKVGVGATRLAADLLGADSVAAFAADTSRTAENIGGGMTQDLRGNEKLVADVTASIMQSAPSLAMGTAGGPALSTLFTQTALAEYNEGRNAGFDVGASLARGGIMGMAEAVGERFGFPQQIKLLRGVVRDMPPNELAKTLGELIKKEIPGEQLTTALQFLADKAGPAAQNPNATFADYLEQAGDTLKTTVAQTAVMGGGPAVLAQGRINDKAVGRSALTQAERLAMDKWGANPYAIANANGFRVEPPLVSDDAKTQRSKTTAIFENTAAQYGIPPSAVARAKAAADGIPAAQLGPFYSRFVQALQKRDLVGAPVDVHVLDSLEAGPVVLPEERAAQAGETKAAETGTEAAKTGTPAAEPDYSGLSEPADQVPAPAPAAGIDEAAHAAATSPKNDLQEPTPAQQDAGNYRKGHARIGGLDVSIENPQGSIRRSKPDAPAKWETEMQHHYGYIRGTVGQDGDHIDTFIKPGTADDFGGTVFVVDQVDPATGKADEHKVMVGFDTEAEARAAYLSNYSKGWKGLGAITATPMADFKTWLKGDTSKPFGASGPTAAAGGATFKTAKGSTYEVHDDGTTSRNKAARSDLGHEGDSGAKPRSAKTVYAEDLRAFQPPDGSTWRVVAHEDGTLSLATKNQDGKWGIAPGSRNIKVETAPRVGLSPLELWSPETVNGLPAYKVMHPGNKITEVGSAPQQPDVPATAGVVERGPAGGGAQPAGGGRDLGRHAYVPTRAGVANTAASPEPGSKQAVPLGAGGESAGAVARTIGRVGEMPNQAEPLELRPNPDGTMTPWLGGYELVDFDSGDPLRLPGDMTDEKAVEAIKAAGSVGRSKKFFGVAKSDSVSTKKAGRSRALDPEKDTLLQALAKLGGVQRQGMASEFGLRPEELKHSVSLAGLKGYPFRAKGGMSVDSAIAAVLEAGYLVGVSDKDARHAFEDAVHKELGGAQVLTPQGHIRQAEEHQEEASKLAQEIAEEDRLEREAIMAEAGLSEAEMSAVDDDDIDVAGTNNTSAQEFMRDVGFTNEEIKSDQDDEKGPNAQAGADEDGQAVSQQESPAAATGVATKGTSPARPQEDLKTKSPPERSYADLEGKMVEQKVQVGNATTPAVLKMDAAKAMRALDVREGALKSLIKCLRSAA